MFFPQSIPMFWALESLVETSPSDNMDYPSGEKHGKITGWLIVDYMAGCIAWWVK